MENDITKYSKEQNLKIDLMRLIQNAADPYDIIVCVAEHLEKLSQEQGYARQVVAEMRAVYGLALKEEKPLADELKEVEERAQRIKAAYEGGDFNDEEKARIKMALEAHEKNIARLQKMINEAE